jgi:hypothetical protein
MTTLREQILSSFGSQILGLEQAYDILGIRLLTGQVSERLIFPAHECVFFRGHDSFRTEHLPVQWSIPHPETPRIDHTRPHDIEYSQAGLVALTFSDSQKPWHALSVAIRCIYLHGIQHRPAIPYTGHRSLMKHGFGKEEKALIEAMQKSRPLKSPSTAQEKICFF